MAKKVKGREEEVVNSFQIRWSKKKIIAIALTLIFSITGISLLLSSFESVDYNEYGLKQNIITKEIDPEVYTVGLYFTGPFATFIRFPSTWQTIEFSPSWDADDIPISTRTEDGLDLEIDISFQYRLREADVLQLYSEYGLDYEHAMVKIARGVLRDVAGGYDALEFFYNRSLISNDMTQSLKSKENILFIQFGEFQLRNIDLPDEFEAAIEAVEVAKQEIKIAEYQQQAAVIRAQTLIIEAQAQMNITIIEAQAAAQALNITITAEGEALFNLAQTLGLNQTELLIYLWINALEELDDTYLIIGMDTPTILDLPG
jgi:regulator of protease activity HflC (stomatin/prohibitin superfamily)